MNQLKKPWQKQTKNHGFFKESLTQHFQVYTITTKPIELSLEDLIRA